MDAGNVLLIAVPVLFGLAVLLAVSTAMSRRRSTTAALTREAIDRDKSEVDVIAADPVADRDAEAHARFGATKAELERSGAVPAERRGGLLQAPGSAPVDLESLGVTRRQFFNRGIITAQLLAIGGFGTAVLAFIWPGQGGGFGGKIRAGALDDILAYIADKKQPFYVPEARTYINPYPKAALAKARSVYKGQTKSMGMEDGIVALYQKCVHLGCRVPWCGTAQWFECPCHGSKYNRVGEKTGGPAPRGLDRWAVEIAGGQVTINTGIPYQGPPIGTNTTGQSAEGPHCIAL